VNPTYVQVLFRKILPFKFRSRLTEISDVTLMKNINHPLTERISLKTPLGEVTQIPGSTAKLLVFFLTFVFHIISLRKNPEINKIVHY